MPISNAKSLKMSPTWELAATKILPPWSTNPVSDGTSMVPPNSSTDGANMIK